MYVEMMPDTYSFIYILYVSVADPEGGNRVWLNSSSTLNKLVGITMPYPINYHAANYNIPELSIILVLIILR